jgi:predicted XRE-type DNA-binding protein
MSELRGNLRDEFQDKEYRHAYADESLSTYIATQIKVLREQRQLTQRELAELAGMAQPRIAVMEDINYSSWSISTLRRMARAFDVRLSVRFENFSTLIPEIETLGREALERDSFADDSWFHKKDAQSAFVGSASDYGSLVPSPHQNEGALAMAVGKVVELTQSPFMVNRR